MTQRTKIYLNGRKKGILIIKGNLKLAQIAEFREQFEKSLKDKNNTLIILPLDTEVQWIKL